MNIITFLKTGIQIAAALGRLHGAGAVHQNIRPENIRLSGEGGEAELLGATTDASPMLADAKDARGIGLESMAYMAPEQTGRMNRPVDHRSDLYALGIVMYEMLAGAPPFAAEDVIGWVHCHVAMPPRPLAEVAPEAPPIVSEIIMKLLAKTAEDRYQSARGLMLDLERCLRDIEARGRAEPFALGARDAWDKLQIPAKLYGRESEVAALFGAFERVVSTGVPSIALVSGYSGIGKSSLVQELHQPIVRARGYFIAGKFDQFKRDIPYFTVAQAFRELIRHILGESEARLNAWRVSLVAALGKNGQLIVDLIPQLQLIIGEQPKVAPLPSAEAQSRMNATFQSFIGVFAKQEHPLALFLDDLQWADLASLNLLHHLLTHQGTRNLFVLGAYRDNEVSASHPLITALSDLRKASVSITELTLGPLSASHVNELVAATTHSSQEDARPLSILLFTKTAGNPFFLTQFLLELYKQGLVRFDAEALQWKADIQTIALMNYTDNVVEFIIGKLNRLPTEAQEALTLAACIGNEFDIRILALILGESLADACQRMVRPLAEGLLLRRATAYKFLHDRVQQAAYTLIPEEKRGEVHLRVGRLVLAGTPEWELDENLFEIVNHLNLGASMISEPNERLRVAGLNLRAGAKAKASSAQKSAANYLAAGLKLLADDSWEVSYALTYALHRELADSELQCGRLDEAERLSVIGQERASTVVEKAAFYQIRMQIRVAKAASDEGIALGIECLKLLGVEIIKEPSEDDLAAAVRAVDEGLKGRPIEALLDLPLVTDPAINAVMSTLSALYVTVAFTLHAKLLELVICRMVSTSVENGNTAPSCLGYASFGANIKLSAGDFKGAYRFAKLGYDLVEKHQFTSYKSQVCNFLCSMVSHWSRHVRDNIRYAREGVQSGIETGNVLLTCLNSVQGMMAVLVNGDPLDQVRVGADACIDILAKAQFMWVADIAVAVQRFAMNMAGLTAHFSTWGDEGFDEAAYDKNVRAAVVPVIRHWCHSTRAISRFLSGDYKEALEEGKLSVEHSASSVFQMPTAECCFFTALSAAALLRGADEAERGAHLAHLAACEEKLRAWAETCPENYLGKLSLVSAEIARVEGRDLDAARLYNSAIRALRESGFVHVEGVANELAARFYIDRGFLTVPDAYLQEAVACFTRWGAEGKVRQLKWLYPAMLGHERAQLSAKEISAQADQLDTATAMKASKALSGEKGPNKLLSSLMRILVEHASAQRCCLLLPSNDEMVIAAEAAVDPRGIRVQIAGDGPALSTSELPMSVVNFVKRSREKVLYNDASQSDAAVEDAYLARARPKSVLCMPIVRHGAVEGVVYLENRLVPGAFTARRQALLEFLALVSLENATLTADLEKENADRRRAEATLRESEDRMRRLIESANLIPWEAMSASEPFTYFGPHMAKLLGYSPAEWHGRAAGDFLRAHVHPDDLDSALRQFFDKERRTPHTDIRMLTTSGRALWLHSVVNEAPPEGGQDPLSGFFIDITERKEVESTLREQLETIQKQQEAIRSLSAPIIEVWEGILTMPIFGPIDAQRAMQMTEVLLDAVVRTRCQYSIIDLTGVETVDTNTANHIIKIVSAVQLLGSQGIVVGIRPEVAQTMISIGADLTAILTLGNLREALVLCMNRGKGGVRRRSSTYDTDR